MKRNETTQKLASEMYPAKDDYQREYRGYFGNIVDKYLIWHEKDGEKQLIIYIDVENDIDWIDKREEILSPEEQQKMDECLNMLDIAQSKPYVNLSDVSILNFKKMLGTGYNAALHHHYDLVQPVINEAVNFLKQRNREEARILFLKSTSAIVFFSLLIFCISFFHTASMYKEWYSGIIMGILGAYISIWLRYGRVYMIGLSSKELYYLESAARLLSGAVFAIVGVLLLKCGFLFKDLTENHMLYSCGLIGFIAGFNERFIPSIAEKMVKNETKKDEQEIDTNH